MEKEELIDVLAQRFKGLRGDVEDRKKAVLESLMPKNFLTTEEVERVREALANLVLPSPRSTADALLFGSRRRDAAGFSPDRAYCAVCARNLANTLYSCGFQDQAIFDKLEEAAKIAERYGVGGES